MFAGVRREEDGESLQQAGAGRIELLMLDVTDSKQIAAVTQALLPLVRAARGRVVFVGSVNGRLSSPEKVAAAIEHALSASRPRTRYLVGSDARARPSLLASSRIGSATMSSSF